MVCKTNEQKNNLKLEENNLTLEFWNIVVSLF